MAKRGRASGAELTVPKVDPIEVIERPDAPYDLTDEQAEEWWAVVNRLPAEWFPRETHALLAQYCRHVVAARRVAELIDACQNSESFEVQRVRPAAQNAGARGQGVVVPSHTGCGSRSNRHSIEERKKGTGGFKKPWQ